MNSVARQPLDLYTITAQGSEKREYELTVYPGMVNVKRRSLAPSRPTPGAMTRGQITTFSDRSRKNMITSFLKTDGLQVGRFITLTYPDEVWFVKNFTGNDLERNRRAFQMALERAFPGVKSFWRKEWKARLSGGFQGQVAPHLHLLTDGIDLDIGELRRWTRETWQRVIGFQAGSVTKRLQVDVQACTNERQAMIYLSKYLAKADEESISEFFHKHAGEIGRHWGTRGDWRRPRLAVVRLSRSQYLALRRLARKAHKKRGRDSLARSLAWYYCVGFDWFMRSGSENVWETDVGKILCYILSF